MPAVIVNIQRQPGANIIAVVDRIKASAAAAPELRCRRPSRSPSSPTAPPPFAPRCSDVQFELMLTIALVVMVIFLFLRNVSRHRHSQRRRAAVARRHVRRHVPARLQPEQSVADGADHLHRLRRRRRHRDDREHRRATSRKASRRSRPRSRARSRSASPSCR